MAKDFNFIEEGSESFGKRKAAPASQSKMVNFLVRKGLAKSESQANLILLIVIIISVSVIIYFNFIRGGGSASVDMPSLKSVPI